MKQDFLYKTISNQIKTWIEQGKFDSTRQLPTTKELSKDFDTSPMTINKALEVLVHEGYITRLAGKGTFVAERAGIPLSGQQNRHGLIGAIVYDTSHHSLWARALRGIEDALQVNGYNLIIGNDDGNAEKAAKYITDFANLNIDGIIFVPIGYPSKAEYDNNNMNLIQQIEDSGIPHILFHRLLDSHNATVVTLDDYNDTVRLISRFLERKIERPVCLSHYFTTCSYLREKGFIDTLSEFGYDNPQKFVKRIQPFGQITDSKVKDQVLDFLMEIDNVDGIFAVENDILNVAKEVVESSETLSARNLQFCCFDYSGTINSEEVMDIMDVPIYEMGAFAGETILRKINSTKYIDHKIQFYSSFRSR